MQPCANCELGRQHSPVQSRQRLGVSRAQRPPGRAGTHLQATDTVVTGADGSAGIAFVDNSLLSVGPNSVLAIERYAFNSTTHEGAFESSLRRGTLSVVSGKIAKQSPDAMKVKTPSSILGVRGTEFLVRSSD